NNHTVDMITGKIELRLSTEPQTSTYITYAQFLRSMSSSLDVGADKDQVMKDATSLRYYERSNKPLDQRIVVHTGLVEIRFDCDYNRPIEPGTLPPSLKQLHFGTAFNQMIRPGVLPNTLQTLLFSSNYNQPLTVGVLPLSLTFLIFGSQFNQELLPGVLPPSLKKLILGSQFKRNFLCDVLPHSITSLYIGSIFEQIRIDGPLPQSLTLLRLSERLSNQLTSDLLPSGIIELEVPSNSLLMAPGSLPSGLKTMKFVGLHRQPLPIGLLPSTLTYLRLGLEFNQPIPIGALPEGLKTLIFQSKYKTHLEIGTLPNSITDLNLMYQAVIPTQLIPTSIITLTIGDTIYPIICNGIDVSLPHSLTCLTLGNLYNNDITPGLLPPSLTQLYLGSSFNKPIEPGVLPGSITNLTLASTTYTHPLSSSILPEMLQHLTFSVVCGKPDNRIFEIQTDMVKITISFTRHNQPRCFFRTYQDKYLLRTLFEWITEEQSLVSWMLSDGTRDQWMKMVTSCPIYDISMKGLIVLPHNKLPLRRLTIQYGYNPTTRFPFQANNLVQWLMNHKYVDELGFTTFFIKGCQQMSIRKMNNTISPLFVINNRLEGGYITVAKLEMLLKAKLINNHVLCL
ncbi:hypothetical protein SAMD00019534_100790, partial [Acytostelium subglobosum LB1]|uniref:hypothetical protein n=1 Tax=Acytostelium subglobosum LB1 TaxID=1410327 RepID=UPI000644A04D